MEFRDDSEKELTALVEALKGLKPAECRLNRDAMLFYAGRASAEVAMPTTKRFRTFRHWGWPLVTAASLGIAVMTVLNPRTETLVVAPEPAGIVLENQLDQPAAVSEDFEHERPVYLLERQHVFAGHFGTTARVTSGVRTWNPPSSRGQIVEELIRETLL